MSESEGKDLFTLHTIMQMIWCSDTQPATALGLRVMVKWLRGLEGFTAGAHVSTFCSTFRFNMK